MILRSCQLSAAEVGPVITMEASQCQGSPSGYKGGCLRDAFHSIGRRERNVGVMGGGMGWLPKLQGLSSLDRTGASSRAGEEVLETEHALPEEKKSNRLAVVHP